MCPTLLIRANVHEYIVISLSRRVILKQVFSFVYIHYICRNTKGYMNTKKFSWADRLGSFRYAFRGIGYLVAGEHNARIHSVAAVLVVVCGFYFGLSAYEWIAVVFAIGFVFALEGVNSAVEVLCDFVSPERREIIGRVKDLAAGAVLIAAISAAVIGGIVFFPKIAALLSISF